MRHRADGLPLFLQRLDELGRLLPVARVGERLDARGQLLLLRQVRALLLVEDGEVRARALVHLIGGGLEALPQLLLLLLRRRAGRLPLDVELAQLVRGLLQIRLFEERLGAWRTALRAWARWPSASTPRLRRLVDARAQLVARRLPARFLRRGVAAERAERVVGLLRALERVGAALGIVDGDGFERGRELGEALEVRLLLGFAARARFGLLGVAALALGFALGALLLRFFVDDGRRQRLGFDDFLLRRRRGDRRRRLDELRRDLLLDGGRLLRGRGALGVEALAGAIEATAHFVVGAFLRKLRARCFDVARIRRACSTACTSANSARASALRATRPSSPAAATCRAPPGAPLSIAPSAPPCRARRDCRGAPRRRARLPCCRR